MSNRLIVSLPTTSLTSDHHRYDLKSRLPGNWVTVKAASRITGMTANAIHQAIHLRRVDAIRAGQGGWGADRRYHNEIRLESLYDYIQTKDPRGRKGAAV